ncbi:MAG: ATPase domain-containing protein [Nitrososphaerales archaeon]
MPVTRVSTSVKELDPFVEGGFPRGSLILICGEPGTGKSIFSAQFIYDGAVNYDEKGIYVSFSEDRQTFFDNMERFYNFRKLESEDKFCFMEMLTGQEAMISESLKALLERIRTMEAKRVVIDSFSTFAQAVEKPIEARSLLHNILDKIVRKEGCTTLITGEIPPGVKKVILGSGEFVADGVIILRRKMHVGRLIRELEILKLRGTRLSNPRFVYTLENGFHVFPPTLPETKLTGVCEVIPHQPNRYSTGIRDLDNILTDGFIPGSYDLLEVDEDVGIPLELLLVPIISNFLSQGYPVIILPPQGISANKMIEVLKDVTPPLENLKIVDYRFETEETSASPYVLPLSGRSIIEDTTRFWTATLQLMKLTRRPALSIVGFDTVEYVYSEKEALRTLGESVARTKNFGVLRINIARPSMKIIDELRALATIHLRICQIDGAHFLYGVKPNTQLFNIQTKLEGHIRRYRLIPVV